MTEPLPVVHWYRQHHGARTARLVGLVRAGSVVVGGGIAGLSCAARLMELGEEVVLLEGAFLGAGATGKSSGFITPDSELGVVQLRRRFGDARARELWGAAKDACGLIRVNMDEVAHAGGGSCGLIEADSLYAGYAGSGERSLRGEFEAQRGLGFDAAFIEGREMPQHVASERFSAGVRTAGTFGMDGAAYAQGVGALLRARGLAVYEQSPVVSVRRGVVRTPHGEVRAGRVFVCTDRFMERLGVARRDVYHARTYLGITRPLGESVLKALMPRGPVMVWDTSLVYSYFRPTSDMRLLVGGSLLTHTGAGRTPDVEPARRHLRGFIERTFPQLGPVEFESFWPGLIGLSKDILPLAGRARDGVYVAGCAAGLPWSVMAGRSAAEVAVCGGSRFAREFDPGRAFGPVEGLQPVIGRSATWGASYYYAREYQRGGVARARVERGLVRAGVLGAVVGGVWWVRRGL